MYLNYTKKNIDDSWKKYFEEAEIHEIERTAKYLATKNIAETIALEKDLEAILPLFYVKANRYMSSKDETIEDKIIRISDEISKTTISSTLGVKDCDCIKNNVAFLNNYSAIIVVKEDGNWNVSYKMIATNPEILTAMRNIARDWYLTDMSGFFALEHGISSIERYFLEDVNIITTNVNIAKEITVEDINRFKVRKDNRVVNVMEWLYKNNILKEYTSDVIEKISNALDDKKTI